MKYYYAKTINLILHSFGITEFETEAIYYLETVIYKQLQDVLRRAKEISKYRNSSKISAEDILFLFRKNNEKLNKYLVFLSVKKYNKKKKDILNEEKSEKYEWIFNDVNTNCNDNLEIQKLKIYDNITKNMSKREYEKFIITRQASFTGNDIRRFKKFVGEWKIGVNSLELLGLMCNEMIFKLLYETIECDDKGFKSKRLELTKLKLTCWKIVINKKRLY